MAFGVTDTGFKAKKFDDIKTEVAASLKTELGIDITSLPDSIAEVITNIYILPLSQSWANTQSLQSMFDIDKATGVWLDNLVALRGIRRSKGTYPFGNIYVTSSNTVNILTGSSWSDISSNTFTNLSNILISEEIATSVKYTVVDSSTQGLEYVLVIDDVTYDEFKPITTSIEDVMASLKSKVETDRPDLVFNYTDNTLTLESIDTLKQFSVVPSASTLLLLELTGYGQITSDTLSTEVYLEDTVTVSPKYTDIISINNPEPISNGAGEEEDGNTTSKIQSYGTYRKRYSRGDTLSPP